MNCAGQGNPDLGQSVRYRLRSHLAQALFACVETATTDGYDGSTSAVRQAIWSAFVCVGSSSSPHLMLRRLLNAARALFALLQHQIANAIEWLAASGLLPLIKKISIKLIDLLCLWSLRPRDISISVWCWKVDVWLHLTEIYRVMKVNDEYRQRFVEKWLDVLPQCFEMILPSLSTDVFHLVIRSEEEAKEEEKLN